MPGRDCGDEDVSLAHTGGSRWANINRNAACAQRVQDLGVGMFGGECVDSGVRRQRLSTTLNHRKQSAFWIMNGGDEGRTLAHMALLVYMPLERTE